MRPAGSESRTPPLLITARSAPVRSCMARAINTPSVVGWLRTRTRSPSNTPSVWPTGTSRRSCPTLWKGSRKLRRAGSSGMASPMTTFWPSAPACFRLMGIRAYFTRFTRPASMTKSARPTDWPHSCACTIQAQFWRSGAQGSPGRSAALQMLSLSMHTGFWLWPQAAATSARMRSITVLRAAMPYAPSGWGQKRPWWSLVCRMVSCSGGRCGAKGATRIGKASAVVQHR